MMKEMRSRPAWFLALAMLSLNGLMANAGRADPLVSHDPNKVTDLTFGIFCASKPDCSTTEKDTISGSISRHDYTPRMLRRTQTIPAIDGLMFGVMLRFQPPSDTGFLLRVDLTLPPTFIQLERDSRFQFCPVGRVVQRGLARSWSWGAASDPVAG